jgi:MFS family permease
MASVQVPRLSWAAITGGGTLFQEEGFRRLWLGRLISHSANNAILYAFLILVVQKTGSNIHAGLLVVSYVLPTATLGTISGVVVDRLPKGLVLFVANVARAGLLLALVATGDSVWAIYVVALLLAVASQFIMPAESAALPLVVPQEQLMRANSLNNLGSVASQAVGMAALAPAFLATVGGEALYVVAALLFVAGGAVFAAVPGLGGLKPAEGATTVRDVRAQFARAWHTLTGDMAAYMSVVMLVLANATALVCVTLVPRFATKVLEIPAENAIFVFMPAALGVIAGLRLVEWMSRRMSRGWLIGGAFGLLVGGLVAVGMVRQNAGALEGLNPFGLFSPGPFGEQAALILVTMAFTIVLAFAYTIVNIAGRSLINERMPLEMQGRIFAAQVVLTNLASIPPILLSGALADVIGVTPVLVIVAIVLLAVAGWAGAQRVARQPSAG